MHTMTVFTRQHPECISAHNTDTGLNSRDGGALVTRYRTKENTRAEFGMRRRYGKDAFVKFHYYAADEEAIRVAYFITSDS
jgi:hypothetical protein